MIIVYNINGMANTDFNNTVFDNTAANFNFSPDNTATSDELKVGETYNHERETNFAKLKRKIKIAKIAIFSVTVTITGGAIVVGLTQNKNAIKTPVVESLNFRVKNKTLFYSFKLTDINNYKVIFTIKNSKENIYEVVLDKNDTYENSYDLSSYSGSMSASLDYSNEVDHYGNLYTFNFEL
ncbi:MAG: hypothetical protein KBS97_02975 [Firmicutes bacterium]|nr:hypothetical protein [Candidatus Fiminaster equi]